MISLDGKKQLWLTSPNYAYDVVFVCKDFCQWQAQMHGMNWCWLKFNNIFVRVWVSYGISLIFLVISECVIHASQYQSPSDVLRCSMLFLHNRWKSIQDVYTLFSVFSLTHSAFSIFFFSSLSLVDTPSLPLSHSLSLFLHSFYEFNVFQIK